MHRIWVMAAVLLGPGAYTIPRLSAQAPGSAEASVREAYASLPGARIFYRDSGGRGVPVVFLHAATGSRRVWEYQIPPFLGAAYLFLAFDRRGWGRTAIEPTGPQPGTGADDLLG